MIQVFHFEHKIKKRESALGQYGTTSFMSYLFSGRQKYKPILTCTDLNLLARAQGLIFPCCPSVTDLILFNSRD